MGGSTLRFAGAMEEEGQSVPARDPEDTEVATKQNACKFLPESAVAGAPVNYILQILWPCLVCLAGCECPTSRL